MREIKLYAYPTVTVENPSYTGGNQAWFEKTTLKNQCKVGRKTCPPCFHFSRNAGT